MSNASRKPTVFIEGICQSMTVLAARDPAALKPPFTSWEKLVFIKFEFQAAG